MVSPPPDAVPPVGVLNIQDDKVGICPCHRFCNLPVKMISSNVPFRDIICPDPGPGALLSEIGLMNK
jgi:hypothetical protein